GHGFSIEILPNSGFLMQWYAFAPDGGATWINGTGRIVGNTAKVVGYQITGPGAVFYPGFDESAVQPQVWGSLVFTFYDCNNGKVDWTPIAVGYVAGS